MTDAVTVALISAGGTFLTAVVALLINQRGFAQLDKRIDDTNHRMDAFAQDLRDIRADLKEFFKIQAEFDKRLARIEDKLKLPQQ